MLQPAQAGIDPGSRPGASLISGSNWLVAPDAAISHGMRMEVAGAFLTFDPMEPERLSLLAAGFFGNRRPLPPLAGRSTYGLQFLRDR